jgi:hypothetical protein
MENFLSFILLLMLFAAGFLAIYLIIDFFEYLKKFHAVVWEELCFERPFGIPREDFFFYPVRPLKFIPFLFAGHDSLESDLAEYKKRIKYALAGMAAVMAINFFFRIIF